MIIAKLKLVLLRIARHLVQETLVVDAYIILIFAAGHRITATWIDRNRLTGVYVSPEGSFNVRSSIPLRRTSGIWRLIYWDHLLKSFKSDGTTVVHGYRWPK